MKKIIGFIAMSLVALMPFTVKAATGIVPNCGNQDENGEITCTISYNITDSTDSLTVTLTEQGGAQVIDATEASDSLWTVSSKNELNNVWTIALSSPGVTGEGSLFTFKYKPSGETDCKVVVGLNNEKKDITPAPIPDTPADNKQTGATLPYIALGTIAVLAVGAYIATRNKAKMYRI